MKYTKTILVVAAGVAAVVVTGAVTFIGLRSATAVAQDARRSPQLVQVATARRATAPARGFTGIVSARVQSNLGFRVQGKVIARLVDSGARVQAGQALMRIDPQDLALALAARTNAVAAVRA